MQGCPWASWPTEHLLLLLLCCCFFEAQKVTPSEDLYLPYPTGCFPCFSPWSTRESQTPRHFARLPVKDRVWGTEKALEERLCYKGQYEPATASRAIRNSSNRWPMPHLPG